ncbi:MAG: hypothetical protein ACOYN4_21095 [Bacteroidales bacterium]
MKTRIQYFVAIIILAIISFSTSVLAQPNPDPGGGGIPGGGDPGGGSIGGGSGAPIGDGIYFLIALAVAYGISRWYATHKQNSVYA